VHDRETGLFYNVTRDYRPSGGRYDQYDSIGLAGGINPYIYTFGQPTRFIDPDGRQVQVLPSLAPALVAGCVLSPGCRNFVRDLFSLGTQTPPRDPDRPPSYSDPILLDPGYKPGSWPPPPIDPPTDKPEAWPKDDKNFCIRTYANCINYGWRGNCQACFDRCNGSAAGDWPFHMCRPKKMKGNWCEPGSE
jgi:RHS repeat-associated protein